LEEGAKDPAAGRPGIGRTPDPTARRPEALTARLILGGETAGRNTSRSTRSRRRNTPMPLAGNHWPEAAPDRHLRAAICGAKFECYAPEWTL